MDDSPPTLGTRDDTGVEPDCGPTAYPGTPRWVKISGIITLIVVVLVVIVMVVSGGGHGPARHMPSGVPAGHTPAAERGMLRA
jgi:hypothetical protein